MQKLFLAILLSVYPGNVFSDPEDGPKLLAEVYAKPDDDLPRLVYADWLEENGDATRAAFIRASIHVYRE